MTGARQGSAAVHRRPRRSRGLWAIPFMIPAAGFVIAIIIVPSVRGTVYSFSDWDGLSAGWNFVGLDNFARLIGDQLAIDSFRQTLLLTVVTTVAMNVLGLALALALNTRIRTKGILRVVFFAPVIITPVIIANLWRYLLLPEGPVNGLLRAIGLEALTQPWLGNSDTAIWAVMGTIVWQFTGIAMVIYLAGLQNVPAEVVEAARMDGAGSWRVFLHITLPELRPAAVITSLLLLIGGLKSFDQVWVLTQGGPGTSTHTLSTAQYQVTFLFGDYAYGATFAVAIAVLAIAIAVIQQIVAGRRGR